MIDERIGYIAKLRAKLSNAFPPSFDIVKLPSSHGIICKPDTRIVLWELVDERKCSDSIH